MSFIPKEPIQKIEKLSRKSKVELIKIN
jgi:hypothetical protein